MPNPEKAAEHAAHAEAILTRIGEGESRWKRADALQTQLASLANVHATLAVYYLRAEEGQS